MGILFTIKQDKMDTLKSKIDYYNDLVKRAIQTDDASLLPEIRSLNRTITGMINDEIEKLTYLRKESPDILEARDRLIQRLREVQKDYNGMLENADNLTTLRRIREEEGAEGKRMFTMYMFAFLGLCSTIAVYLVFFAQKRATTAMMANTAPKMPSLV